MILGLGDFHLSDSRGVGGLSRFYPDDSDTMILGWVREVVAKEQPEMVIQYGDICDGRIISYHALLGLAKLINWSDVEWNMITGNHDPASNPDVRNWCRVLMKLCPKCKVWLEPGSDNGIHYMPWPCDKFKSKELNVCHLELAGSKLDNGHKSKSDIKGKGHVVAGHIHTAGGQYCGTLYPLTFGEDGSKKGYHLIEPDTWDIRWCEFNCGVELRTVNNEQELVDTEKIKSRLMSQANLDVRDMEVEMNVVQDLIDAHPDRTELNRVRNQLLRIK